MISFANSGQFCSAVAPKSVPVSPGPSIGCLSSTNKGNPRTCCAPGSSHGVCPGTASFLKTALETSPPSLKMLSQGSHFYCMSFTKLKSKIIQCSKHINIISILLTISVEKPKCTDVQISVPYVYFTYTLVFWVFFLWYSISLVLKRQENLKRLINLQV